MQSDPQPYQLAIVPRSASITLGIIGIIGSSWPNNSGLLSLKINRLANFMLFRKMRGTAFVKRSIRFFCIGPKPSRLDQFVFLKKNAISPICDVVNVNTCDSGLHPSSFCVWTRIAYFVCCWSPLMLYAKALLLPPPSLSLFSSSSSGSWSNSLSFRNRSRLLIGRRLREEEEEDTWKGGKIWWKLKIDAGNIAQNQQIKISSI